jgi:hypothetical protein
MDDNTVEEILSELGGHQGCPAPHTVTTHGRGLIHGRGSHGKCIKALKTMTKIGPAYGIHLCTVKVLLRSSGGHDQSDVRRGHYLFGSWC